jgi:uncharacterized membrane protein
MLESLFSALQNLPKELITIIVAAMPVSELRGAIPLAILTLKEPVSKVFFLSILGNLIPVIPLLIFLEPLTKRLRRFEIWHKFFEYIFARTRRKAAIVEKYEAIGLALFVAIPLPITGAWTGCIAASLFKIKFRYAFLAISLGVCLAAVIVTAVTLIGEGILFRLFLLH